MKEPRKMRGLYESPRGSRIWHISYCDAEGRRHREKVGPRSAAIAAYQLRKTEIRLGKFFPPKRATRIPFSLLVEKALADKRARLAARSYYADQVRTQKLLAEWQSSPIESITPPKIEAWLQAMRERGISGATANRYRSLLSSIFSYAIRAGMASANPVAKVPRYKESAGRVRFLAEDEERALRKIIRKECPEREAELDLSLNTGIRRGEQFTLTWDRVDRERKLLNVHGKTGPRFVEMNSAALRAIEKLYRRSNGSQFVCPEAQWDGQRDWRRWFEEAIGKAEIDDFTWHDLRHTFASRLVMAGVDIRTVQELLGHKSILQTMRYAHLAPSHRLAAVEKIAPVVKSGTGSGSRQKRSSPKITQMA
ncbi:MAG: tyrosine-type recombinase/integrase [Candidatus Acidiferrales bacterium]